MRRRFATCRSVVVQAIMTCVSVVCCALPCWADAGTEPVIERNSLVIEKPKEAWLGPGFRLGIGFGYTSMIGVAHAPSWWGYELAIVPQYRIDPQWALGLGLNYAFPQGGVGGIAWRVMAETTYQPIRGVLVQWGLGIAGLNIQRHNVLATVVPTANTSTPTDEGDNTPLIGATYTTTDDRVILKECDGTGVAARAGLGYAFVVGTLFSTGPSVHIYGQWVQCGQTIDGGDDTDPVTGRPLEIRQWWIQWGWTAGWMFAWR